MMSLDLQDACLQVLVHPSSRHYLRFCVGDSVLQFRALCFGLSTAPYVFTRVMAPISFVMHRFRFRILRYLDDWLVLGSSFWDIVRAKDFLLWLCRELGVRDPQVCPEALLSASRVRLLSAAASVSVASAPRGDVLSVGDHSGVSSADEVSPAAPQHLRSSSSRLRLGVLGRVLPCGSLVVVRRVPSAGRSTARPSTSRPRSLHRRLGFGLGRLSSG